MTDIPRVLLSTLRYPPARGGVERYNGDVVAAGRDTGAFTVDVVSTDLADHRTGRRLDAVDDPAHVKRLPAEPRFGRWTHPQVPRLRATLESMADGYEVLQGTSLYYQTFDIAAAVARDRDMPFVASLHGYRRRRTAWPYWRRIGRLLGSSQAVATTVSGFEEGLLRDIGVLGPSVDVVRISPLVDANPYSTTVEDVGSSGVVELLFLGRQEAGKGVEDLVDIAHGVRRSGVECRLTIVGPRGEATPQLEAAAAQHPTMVRFVGEVSDEDRLRHLATADVLVLPTRYEAFGIVLVEAMRSGTVPAAYPVGAVPEVLDHGARGVLAAASTPVAMADAIVRALRDGAAFAPDHRRAVAETAGARFGLDRWRRQWTELYRSLT